MESGVLIVLGSAVAAATAIVGFLSWSSFRAAHNGQVERRLQMILDAYAEREIARERIKRAARKNQNATPHGTILQLQ
jgi:hypothetical protein